ncbi:MAG TPA: NADPH-dependent F420 reductase [Kiloniellales bacterium]|nr:NADPH-dependent F420 reductase [Kiloniellales bacterium]
MPETGESAAVEVAIVGGTGALGSGLALRALRAGVSVCIGSRSPDKAEAAAARLFAQVPRAKVFGKANPEAAALGRLVIVTVPFASQLDTLDEIRDHVRDKIVVDTTVPLVPPKVARVQLPPEGSAALRARTALGDDVSLVSAFHNVAAAHLASDHPIDCDILVFGDRAAARETVAALVARMGLRAWHGGSLANSAAAEALTSVLLFVNRHHKIAGAGLRITGQAAD